MHGVRLAVMTCMGIASIQSAAAREIRIDVSLPQQIMVVSVDDVKIYEWIVSTGYQTYRGAPTPTGTYVPYALDKHHRSRHFHHARMPYSIFFEPMMGIAIHAAVGDDELANLGKPASHGCVRISPENAVTLFELVKLEGMDHTNITVVDANIK